MKILITGGFGFIGSHVVAALGDIHDIDILDGFDKEYMSYKYIHRGTRGLEETNDIEKRHREINLKYRLNLIKNKFKQFHRGWSFNNLPKKDYDIILNFGGLSEAILSKYFVQFTEDSIVKGMRNLKARYPNTPFLHISSSMVYGTWQNKIDEKYPVKSVDLYGNCKINAEKLCGKNDIILRPIHVYGIGDGKYPIWMNIERQMSVNKPVLVEEASCIYIEDFVIAIKNILDKWISGTYNISYNFTRTVEALKTVYPLDFKSELKLGPTGKPRGTLDCNKLLETFEMQFKYSNYEDTIRDYYEKYEAMLR